MGMAAAQARFLGLTARKTNLEYEGQQVNQQRTALSNQSANYYSQLLGMSVPVVPQIADYTQTVYSFEDGALTNTITSIIAKNNGNYSVSYLSKHTDDFSVTQSLRTSLVTKTGTASYEIGADSLRKLGSVYENKVGIGFRWNAETGRYETDVYNFYYIDTAANMRYISPTYFKNANGKYQAGQDANGNKIYYTYNGTSFNQKPCEKNTFIIPHDTYNEVYNGDVNFNTEEYDLEDIQQKYTPTAEKQWVEEKLVYTLPEDFILDVGDSDQYLASLTEEQMQQLELEERNYVAILNAKYGTPQNGWYVRYVYDNSIGKYKPVFYNADDIINGTTDEYGNIISHVQCYEPGSTQVQTEIKNQEAKFERDSSGRYINITLYDANNNPITYALTTNTVTDQAAYDDAMNQYEYDKHQYDQKIQEINAKIEITHAEDKKLELRLKQLDTEQSAISTEMDAVSKIIDKNVQSTFKTFG